MNRSMRASTLLVQVYELFQDRYDWREAKTEAAPEYHVYRFKTGEGHPYFVNINQAASDKHPASVEFGKEDIANRPTYSFQGVFGISGEEGGHSQKILSTVHHILKTHLQNHPEVKAISFTAEEPSRQKLYRHMARRFATRVNEVPTPPNPRAGYPLPGAKYTINREDIPELQARPTKHYWGSYSGRAYPPGDRRNKAGYE